MRKIIWLLILTIFPTTLFAQLQGDGRTPATAFYGTLNSGTRTWDYASFSGTVYIGRSGVSQADIIVSGTGKIIIQPGITVVFCTTGSEIRVSQGGILEANGSFSNKITFTQISGNTNWGHLVFSNNPGASVINNCIIQNGRSSDFLTIFSGGGLFASCNNLRISNSIFRNNSAGAQGGGIYADGSILIENCLIYSNSAGEGGGISIYSNVSVNNCTIVDNITPDVGTGDDVYFGSETATLRNTIVWRPSIYGSSIYFSTTPASSNIINCAITEAWASSEIPVETFTSSFKLNLVNTAVDGPLFTDPATNNYAITLRSPCRDNGTSQGSPAPPVTDFLGNSRIGIYDIGAYEVQFCEWKTNAATTDWSSASNWNGGVPTSSLDIIIPEGATNYPTSTPAPDFTIGAGKQMIIESGACVTLGVLTNNGTLKLNSSGLKSASLILSGYNRGAGGTEEIQLALTGGGDESNDNFKWHFISTPVTTLPVNIFSPFITQDLAQYIENRPVFSTMQGWVAYDGYVYSTGATSSTTFSALLPGKGYDYWNSYDHTFTFSGLLNTNSVVANLGFNGDPAIHGFNLLGNPFSSGLDWDYILNSGSYPANTSKALYYTRDNQQVTYAAGIGIPADATGIIPPMQGFFNKTYSTGNSITLASAARTHNNIHDRYKKGSEIIPLVRLGITENSASDETVVRFDENAKPGLDYDFDAVKMYLSPSKPYIYSGIAGTNYAINGQPFPEEMVDIPITVNITQAGNHVITAKQVQGLNDYHVTLIDNTTGYKVDLRYLPRLVFYAEPGKYTDRFVLKISTFPTGIEDPEMTGNAFSVFQNYENINILTLSENWSGNRGSISLFDITGRQISRIDNKEFIINSFLQIPSPVNTGIYLLEIRSGAQRLTYKIFIN